MQTIITLARIVRCRLHTCTVEVVKLWSSWFVVAHCNSSVFLALLHCGGGFKRKSPTRGRGLSQPHPGGGAIPGYGREQLSVNSLSEFVYRCVCLSMFLHHFSSHVSTLTRHIDIAILSACLSVRPSVAFYVNDLIYCHNFFTSP